MPTALSTVAELVARGRAHYDKLHGPQIAGAKSSARARVDHTDQTPPAPRLDRDALIRAASRRQRHAALAQPELGRELELLLAKTAGFNTILTVDTAAHEVIYSVQGTVADEFVLRAHTYAIDDQVVSLVGEPRDVPVPTGAAAHRDAIPPAPLQDTFIGEHGRRGARSGGMPVRPAARLAADAIPRAPVVDAGYLARVVGR